MFSSGGKSIGVNWAINVYCFNKHDMKSLLHILLPLFFRTRSFYVFYSCAKDLFICKFISYRVMSIN